MQYLCVLEISRKKNVYSNIQMNTRYYHSKFVYSKTNLLHTLSRNKFTAWGTSARLLVLYIINYRSHGASGHMEILPAHTVTLSPLPPSTESTLMGPRMEMISRRDSQTAFKLFTYWFVVH